ncbi:MAG: hypothetical protein E7495_07990 [Ruminococcus flavefaciens]|jgi:hypothetical protein|nr:hypothetical protein [Ruminococcus flavefaciens]
MKKAALLLVLSAILSLYSCGNNKSDNATEDTKPSVTEEVSAETTNAETETTTAAPKDYVHGDEGYFNLLEEYPEIKLKEQIGGTCWVFSAVNSMETAYAMKNGSYITIAPMELLDRIYLDDKEEGFFVKDGIDVKEVGGWQWMVTETLTNGFGDLTLDSSVILDTSNREAIKENLHTRGSVSIGVNDTSQSYKGWYGGYYTFNYSEEDFDHDITIVGYDDHFPKEYFNIPAAEDGAWIAYNSQYTSGYQYLSYCAPIAYAISHSVADKYSDVIGYDAGNEQDKFIKTGDSTKVANVFHKAGKLAAVGTYNDFDEQDIKIEVYDSTFTNLLYSQDAVLDYHGYHTVVLDTPVDVTDCAVAITYSKGAPVEGETIDTDMGSYKTSIETDQSYVQISCIDDQISDWKDLTSSGIKQFLNIDFEPGNCCIKALYQ